MCSYCGCRNIPLIHRLTEQHEEIVNATYALRTAARQGDREAAAAAAKQLAELMHPHTGLEERGLFAEMRKDEMFTEHIDSLCGEHSTIEL
ncbi:MAG TPA: hemerythrin domain-containing protein, partial [Nakamurella sp.]